MVNLSEPALLLVFTLVMAALLLALLFRLRNSSDRAADLQRLRWLKLLFISAVFISVAQLPSLHAWLHSLNTPHTISKQENSPSLPEKMHPPPDKAVSEFPELVSTGFVAVLRYNEGGIDFAKKENYMQVLARRILKTNEEVIITGHTDYVGTVKDNHQLGLALANSVAHKMEEYGVATDRITVESAGENQPVASNTTEEGRRRNRRVEIRLR